jgi:hypothetical protein
MVMAGMMMRGDGGGTNITIYTRLSSRMQMTMSLNDAENNIVKIGKKGIALKSIKAYVPLHHCTFVRLLTALLKPW